MALVSGGKQTPGVYVNINRKITYIPHNFLKGTICYKYMDNHILKLHLAMAM